MKKKLDSFVFSRDTAPNVDKGWLFLLERSTNLLWQETTAGTNNLHFDQILDCKQ